MPPQPAATPTAEISGSSLSTAALQPSHGASPRRSPFRTHAPHAIRIARAFARTAALLTLSFPLPPGCRPKQTLRSPEQPLPLGAPLPAPSPLSRESPSSHSARHTPRWPHFGPAPPFPPSRSHWQLASPRALTPPRYRPICEMLDRPPPFFSRLTPLDASPHRYATIQQVLFEKATVFKNGFGFAFEPDAVDGNLKFEVCPPCT